MLSPADLPHSLAARRAGASAPRNAGWGSAGVMVLCAIGLTCLFWWPLWTGGGLIGGDVYAYFLPQKAFFAESLHRGEFPLWNNRVGWGYPLVGESQTAPFYPLNVPLYFGLELNTAYNVSLLLHYFLAFCGVWLYAREWKLSSAAALLAALVYVYGWFPSRVSLEWAMIGGTWLPFALWLVERFLQSRFWRYPLWLAVVLGVQLLAGHFTLAFVTQLTLLGYALLRLYGSRQLLPEETAASRPGCLGAVVLSLAAGFGLAGMQLGPTWELKHLSQRQEINAEHDPGFGHIPPRYWLQAVVPWRWYSGEFGVAERRLQELLPPGASRTNTVEAHLYFGLLPLMLLAGGLIRWREVFSGRAVVWVVLGGATCLYTSGWLIPITRHLPGFSYFEGPGRFGMVTTLAVGLLAGSALEVWLKSCPRRLGWIVVAITLGVTTVDLHLVSRMITSAWLVEHPPLQELPHSPLRQILASQPAPPRIFGNGKNLTTLLGTASLPTYLGLGPVAYYDPELTIPQPWPYDVPPTPAQLDWLRRAGVTHLLSLHSLSALEWPVRLIWQGWDPFFNAAMNHREGVYLYAFEGSRGRIAWEPEEPSDAATRASVSAPGANSPAGGNVDRAESIRLVSYQSNRVAVEVESSRAGRLILTDLAYPGWKVSVDGESAPPLVVERRWRGVSLSAGKHSVVWTYAPRSLYYGGAVSAGTGLILLILGHLRFWHPQWFRRTDPRRERELRDSAKLPPHSVASEQAEANPSAPPIASKYDENIPAD